jgi:hypothetical protein
MPVISDNLELIAKYVADQIMNSNGLHCYRDMKELKNVTTDKNQRTDTLLLINDLLKSFLTQRHQDEIKETTSPSNTRKQNLQCAFKDQNDNDISLEFNYTENRKSRKSRNFTLTVIIDNTELTAVLQDCVAKKVADYFTGQEAKAKAKGETATTSLSANSNKNPMFAKIRQIDDEHLAWAKAFKQNQTVIIAALNVQMREEGTESYQTRMLEFIGAQSPYAIQEALGKLRGVYIDSTSKTQSKLLSDQIAVFKGKNAYQLKDFFPPTMKNKATAKQQHTDSGFNLLSCYPKRHPSPPSSQLLKSSN